jgi:ribosomal protein S11
MSNINQGKRRFFLRSSVAALILVGAGTVGMRAARAQGSAAATPPAQSEAKGTAKSDDKSSVKEHIKQLGKEVSDPGTLQRIKAHEQEAEKRVERIRDRQRKDHGRARPNDAVDLAKSVDKPEGGAPAKADRTSSGAPKKKGEGAPPPAPPTPAATKAAP